MDVDGPLVRPHDAGMPIEESRPDVIELNRRAVWVSIEVVSSAAPADLGRATPCAGWTLSDLLAHMTAQHVGFAAAAAGGGSDLSVWAVASEVADPIAAYVRAAEEVIEAFARDGVAQQQFALPELTTARTFAGIQAVSFHLVDSVVHTWDVARAIGVQPKFDDATLRAALEVAETVPDGPSRQQPGSVFAPAVAVPAETTGLDRIVAMLGRDPGWTGAHRAPTTAGGRS